MSDDICEVSSKVQKPNIVLSKLKTKVNKITVINNMKVKQKGEDDLYFQ